MVERECGELGNELRMGDGVKCLGEKSIVIMVVRSGGRCWLKPEAMVCIRGRRADVVEWRGLKPC